MFPRKCSTIGVAVVALTLALTVKAKADIVATRVVKGTTYYVDVVKSGTMAEVWFRTKPDACSPGDIKVMVIAPSRYTTNPRLTLTQVGSTLCKLKGVYDSGKTVVGCATTGAAGICLIASVPTGGTAAVFCTATVSYTVEKGFADCLQGIRDKIGGSLISDRNWSAFMTGYNLGTAQWSGAIDKAIDLGCSQVR